MAVGLATPANLLLPGDTESFLGGLPRAGLLVFTKPVLVEAAPFRLAGTVESII